MLQRTAVIDRGIMIILGIERRSHSCVKYRGCFRRAWVPFHFLFLPISAFSKEEVSSCFHARSLVRCQHVGKHFEIPKKTGKAWKVTTCGAGDVEGCKKLWANFLAESSDDVVDRRRRRGRRRGVEKERLLSSAVKCEMLQ